MKQFLFLGVILFSLGGSAAIPCHKRLRYEASTRQWTSEGGLLYGKDKKTMALAYEAFIQHLNEMAGLMAQGKLKAAYARTYTYSPSVRRTIEAAGIELPSPDEKVKSSADQLKKSSLKKSPQEIFFPQGGYAPEIDGTSYAFFRDGKFEIPQIFVTEGDKSYSLWDHRYDNYLRTTSIRKFVLMTVLEELGHAVQALNYGRGQPPFISKLFNDYPETRDFMVAIEGNYMNPHGMGASTEADIYAYLLEQLGPHLVPIWYGQSYKIGEHIDFYFGRNWN